MRLADSAMDVPLEPQLAVQQLASRSPERARTVAVASRPRCPETQSVHSLQNVIKHELSCTTVDATDCAACLKTADYFLADLSVK